MRFAFLVVTEEPNLLQMESKIYREGAMAYERKAAT
jgi:hypothetical protein